MITPALSGCLQPEDKRTVIEEPSIFDFGRPGPTNTWLDFFSIDFEIPTWNIFIPNLSQIEALIKKICTFLSQHQTAKDSYPQTFPQII